MVNFMLVYPSRHLPAKLTTETQEQGVKYIQN